MLLKKVMINPCAQSQPPVMRSAFAREIDKAWLQTADPASSKEQKFLFGQERSIFSDMQ